MIQTLIDCMGWLNHFDSHQDLVFLFGSYANLVDIACGLMVVVGAIGWTLYGGYLWLCPKPIMTRIK